MNFNSLKSFLFLTTFLKKKVLEIFSYLVYYYLYIIATIQYNYILFITVIFSFDIWLSVELTSISIVFFVVVTLEDDIGGGGVNTSPIIAELVAIRAEIKLISFLNIYYF